MELLELMKERYSVRAFEEIQIEEDKLDKILEAGRVAPTACNLQPQRILVVQDKENMEKLKTCTKFTFDAPTVCVICVDTKNAWVRKYDDKNHGDIDSSIVTTQMMLQAFSMGIGSTWVCSFDPQEVKKALNIPEGYEVVHMLPMGYPKKDNKPAAGHFKRKELSETVFFEKF